MTNAAKLVLALFLLTPGFATVSNVSLTTSNGAGATVTITSTHSNTAGYLNTAGYVTVGTQVGGTTNTCAVRYSARAARFYLRSDTGTWVALPLANTNIVNSQCILWSSSQITGSSGNTLIVAFTLSFKTPYAATRNIFQQTIDEGTGLTAPWIQVTSYVVQAPALSISSVSPASGIGQDQTFTATITDTAGWWSVSQTHLLINTSGSAVHSCYPMYQSNTYTNSFQLQNDAGSGFIPTYLTPGLDVDLRNNQCIIHGISSSAGGLNSTTLKVTFSISFDTSVVAAFTGLKNVYLYAWDANVQKTTSAFAQFGTWNVVNGATNAGSEWYPSVPPTSGSGDVLDYRTSVSNQDLYACLEDSATGAQIALPGVIVRWIVEKPEAKSGGHTHDLYNGARPALTYGITSATTDSAGCARTTINIPKFAGLYYSHVKSDPFVWQGGTHVVEDTLKVYAINTIRPVNMGDNAFSGFMRGVPDPNHGNYDIFTLEVSNVVAMGKIGKRYQDHNEKASDVGMDPSCQPPISSYINPRWFSVTRAALPWGGWMDMLSLSTFWGSFNVDPHSVATVWDMENPIYIVPGCKGLILAGFLSESVGGAAACAVTPFSGTYLETSPLWHVGCIV